MECFGVFRKDKRLLPIDCTCAAKLDGHYFRCLHKLDGNMEGVHTCVALFLSVTSVLRVSCDSVDCALLWQVLFCVGVPSSDTETNGLITSRIGRSYSFIYLSSASDRNRHEHSRSRIHTKCGAIVFAGCSISQNAEEESCRDFEITSVELQIINNFGWMTKSFRAKIDPTQSWHQCYCNPQITGLADDSDELIIDIYEQKSRLIDQVFSMIPSWCFRKWSGSGQTYFQFGFHLKNEIFLDITPFHNRRRAPQKQ